MKPKRVPEQQIAVFGESGSGKTVMLSSFYGATQEPEFVKDSLFHVVADNAGEGARLHRNYLGMKGAARLPDSNRFSATSYSFTVKLKNTSNAKAMKSRAFDALRLVWHDYPGQWFEADVSGPEEAKRRVDAFKALLGSDVALLLVDGQRLLDNSGEEQRYLKSLLANCQNGLLSLKNDLLENGRPLVKFPRIWMMALSKSDLLPDLDVYDFRDFLIERAAGEIDELRKVLAGLVEDNDALSIFEDYVLLSSAKFDAQKIEVTKRVGLQLILPLAAIFPFERYVKWAEMKKIPHQVIENLLGGAQGLAAVLGGIKGLAAVLSGLKGKLPGPLGLVAGLVGPDLVQGAAKLAADQLGKINTDALDKGDFVTATLTGFQIDLKEAEDKRILLKKP